MNEQFVAYGPARFVTQHPQFDSYRLCDYLTKDENNIRIEVNYYGCSSFQSMPDGQPGFIAAGSGEGYDFKTPGSWKVITHTAWDAHAPHFSFAQNPIEICDTRQRLKELVSGLKQTPLPLNNQAFGKLTPRSVPYPHYEPLTPKRIVARGPICKILNLIGFQTINPSLEDHRQPLRLNRLFATWVYTSNDIETDLHCFWSDLELNGQRLELNLASDLPNNATTRLHLKKGWNFLSGRLKVPTYSWSYLLGLHSDSGCSFHARPDKAEMMTLLLGPITEIEHPILNYRKPGDFQPPLDWTKDPGDISKVTPSRLMAWEQFDRNQIEFDLPFSFEEDDLNQSFSSRSWTFDWGEEFFGHPQIEVEAPEGTQMDIAYDDWLSPGGNVKLYGSNPFVDSADRFILKGGRQRIDVANPRGGIYMQITLRSKRPGNLILRNVSILSRQTLKMGSGSFRSSNHLYNQTYRKALKTLVASTDESYSDCPWRERGDYIADGYVSLHIHRLISDDLRIPRRSLHTFAYAQNEDGSLPPVAPSWIRKVHDDFTLIWILYLRDYWAMTGDIQSVRELWPSLEKIWSSPRWQSHSSGLWNVTDGMTPFIDWGVHPEERTGDANGVLNAFRYAALHASSELALQLSLPDQAAKFATEANELKQAFEKTLWRADDGCFSSNLTSNGQALHSNILALRFGLGDPRKLIAHLEPLLKENLSRGLHYDFKRGFAELYFFHYLLPALAENNRMDLAEQIIVDHYGFLNNLNHATLNECFSRANQEIGSCCHAWSG
ncbi:MAG: hypothetical protein ACQKBU_11910, partial [Verrucomicrobiales bacterium]